MSLEPTKEQALVGKLYFKLLEFERALAATEEGQRLADEAKDFKAWAQSSLFRIRLLKELGRTDDMQLQLADLKQHVSAQEVRSGLSFLMGRLAAEQGDLEDADRLFEIAEASAESQEDELNAAYGRCQILLMKADWRQALAGMEALESRLARYDFHPEIEIPIQLSKVRLALDLKNIPLAVKSLKQAKILSKRAGGLHFHLQVLVTEGFFLVDRNQMHEAQQCWQMIERISPPETGTTLKMRIESLRKYLKGADEAPLVRLSSDGVKTYLQFDEKTVDLTSMAQLSRLLSLFGKNPEKIFSKEDLCEMIWHESYHPLRHDNKIYVTIKRLRSLFKDMDLPAVIINRPDGYMFNPKIRFHQLDPRSSAVHLKAQNTSHPFLEAT